MGHHEGIHSCGRYTGSFSPCMRLGFDVGGKPDISSRLTDIYQDIIPGGGKEGGGKMS